MSDPMLDRDEDLPDPSAGLLPPGFHVFPETIDDAVLVRIEGELDMASAPRLGRVLNAALDQGASAVALDLTELTFLDSTGVRVLISAHRRAADQGCAFTLSAPTRSVRRALHLTGVDQVLVIEPGPSLN